MSQQQNNPEAERIRAAHAQRVEAARGRQDLTPAGRDSRIAKSFIEARDQLAALQQGGRADRAALQADLERSLFGSSSLPGDPATAAISFRDAQDRCATLKTSTEASALLQRSERSDDEALSRAVAAEASAGSTIRCRQAAALAGPTSSTTTPPAVRQQGRRSTSSSASPPTPAASPQPTPSPT